MLDTKDLNVQIIQGEYVHFLTKQALYQIYHGPKPKNTSYIDERFINHLDSIHTLFCVSGFEYLYNSYEDLKMHQLCVGIVDFSAVRPDTGRLFCTFYYLKLENHILKTRIQNSVCKNCSWKGISFAFSPEFEHIPEIRRKIAYSEASNMYFRAHCPNCNVEIYPPQDIFKLINSSDWIE